jgi:hypothetical protein
MEEVPDEDSAMDTSDFAPGGDADYFEEEDEDGRFFGGGLTSEQKAPGRLSLNLRLIGDIIRLGDSHMICFLIRQVLELE